MRTTLLGSIALALSPLAWGHEGHGMHGPHWHATDAPGFVVLAAIVAAALWAARRK